MCLLFSVQINMLQVVFYVFMITTHGKRAEKVDLELDSLELTVELNFSGRDSAWYFLYFRHEESSVIWWTCSNIFSGLKLILSGVVKENMLIILGHLLSMVPSEVQSRELPPLLPLLFEGTKIFSIFFFRIYIGLIISFSPWNVRQRLGGLIPSNPYAIEQFKIRNSSSCFSRSCRNPSWMLCQNHLRKAFTPVSDND